MIKSVWLAVVGTIGLMSVIVPSNVFAATVNCNLAVSTCVGTDNQDTMTISKLTGSSGFYFIDGKGAGDTIVGNVAQKDPGVTGFVVLFSGGDDKIVIRTSVAVPTIELYGGTGSDTISYTGAPGVKLYQDQFSNEPDGKKDTLNCGNAVNSVANISHEDGDVAVNCETVNSQPNP